MLVVRADQMRILGDAQIRYFEQKMAAHVRSRFPDVAGPGEQHSLDFVLRSIRIARTFGIEHEYDLRRFIEFSAEYGEDFHNLDWAASILNDPKLSACGKMERIDDYTLFALR